jgi:hypothetical protein
MWNDKDDPMRVGDEDFRGYGHDWREKEDAFLDKMDQEEDDCRDWVVQYPRSVLADVFQGFNDVFGKGAK